MGIQGLWQVLEPTGRPVNIHSLRGKVLAVGKPKKISTQAFVRLTFIH